MYGLQLIEVKIKLATSTKLHSFEIFNKLKTAKKYITYTSVRQCQIRISKISVSSNWFKKVLVTQILKFLGDFQHPTTQDIHFQLHTKETFMK